MTQAQPIEDPAVMANVALRPFLRDNVRVSVETGALLLTKPSAIPGEEPMTVHLSSGPLEGALDAVTLARAAGASPKTYYVIQGLYGELNSDERVWKDWSRESNTADLARAQAVRANLDRLIGELAGPRPNRTAPTASRIIKRTVIDEAIDA